MSRDIRIDLIDPDLEQPRQHFDEKGLAELAQSMASKGLVVPILVRPIGERFTIVHGERRWRAAQQLGWDTIRAEVRDIDADEARWLSLIENVQREDLSPIEEARAFEAHLDGVVTQAALGERIGKSQQYVSDRLALLRLPNEVQSLLTARAVNASIGRRLVGIEDPELQVRLAKKAASDDLTVRDLQEIKRGWGKRHQIQEFVERIHYQLHGTPFSKGIRVSPLGVDVKVDPPPEEGAKVLETFRMIENALPWWLGDWANYGEEHYGERARAFIDKRM